MKVILSGSMICGLTCPVLVCHCCLGDRDSVFTDCLVTASLKPVICYLSYLRAR